MTEETAAPAISPEGRDGDATWSIVISTGIMIGLNEAQAFQTRVERSPPLCGLRLPIILTLGAADLRRTRPPSGGNKNSTGRSSRRICDPSIQNGAGTNASRES